MTSTINFNLIEKESICRFCQEIWKNRSKNLQSQCPNCHKRKWNKYVEHNPIFVSDHKLVLIKKEPFGRMTDIKYSLDLEGFEEKDFHKMFDLYYACVYCHQLIIAWNEQEYTNQKEINEEEYNLQANFRRPIMKPCPNIIRVATKQTVN
ncbi:MAG: hypothetical protein HeimC3_32480 [Candidatus Heimdallarchaeota archaeon LC_3]|nr:MAG: hypothetical protein HeimC3_32480 [Candidatus Heimdallarchaeota archaeon LC_3]